jgi:hypothetical protein
LINWAHARVNPNSGRDYSAADPTVVALELLTMFGPAPLTAFIVYQTLKDDPMRYHRIIVLSAAELYGGYIVSHGHSIPTCHQNQSLEFRISLD